MKIANALDRFCRQLAANGRSGHTQAAYRRDVDALARWLAPSPPRRTEGMGNNPDLSAVTPDILARFLISDAALCTPEGQPRSPMSVNRTKSALRSFFAFCVESGWIRENPARLIRSSPATPKEPTTLSDDEIAAIRAVLAQKSGPAAERDRLVFEILLGTGIRLGSQVGLKIGGVDSKGSEFKKRCRRQIKKRHRGPTLRPRGRISGSVPSANRRLEDHPLRSAAGVLGEEIFRSISLK